LFGTRCCGCSFVVGNFTIAHKQRRLVRGSFGTKALATGCSLSKRVSYDKGCARLKHVALLKKYEVSLVMLQSHASGSQKVRHPRTRNNLHRFHTTLPHAMMFDPPHIWPQR
jgi:hypothetical protein